MNAVPSPVATWHQAGITFTLSLAMLLAALGTSIANIALPSLATAFAAPFGAVQAVVVAYLATLTVSVLLAGRLGDRFGLRPMLLLGLAIFALAALACALAPSLPWLIGARALQGICAAFLMTLSMALMRQSASAAHIGRAMGLLGTVSALGTALGPTLGGLLIPLAGWRGIFWVQLPLAAIALLLAATKLPREPGRAQVRPPSLWSVLHWRLLPNLVVNLLVAAVMMTTLVVGPFYLGMALGLAAGQVGLVMAIGPTISIVAGMPSGRLVDAWGAGPVLSIGLALLAIGAALLAMLPGLLGVWGYGLAIVVLTPGYQLFQAANNTAALADIATNQRGTVSGLLGLSRNIGLMTGASAMGAVFAWGVGTGDLAQAPAAAIAAGMQLTFVLATGLMLLAAGTAWFGRTRTAH